MFQKDCFEASHSSDLPTPQTTTLSDTSTRHVVRRRNQSLALLQPVPQLLKTHLSATQEPAPLRLQDPSFSHPKSYPLATLELPATTANSVIPLPRQAQSAVAQLHLGSLQAVTSRDDTERANSAASKLTNHEHQGQPLGFLQSILRVNSRVNSTAPPGLIFLNLNCRYFHQCTRRLTRHRQRHWLDSAKPSAVHHHRYDLLRHHQGEKANVRQKKITENKRRNQRQEEENNHIGRQTVQREKDVHRQSFEEVHKNSRQ